MFWKSKPTVSNTLKHWIHDSFDWADAIFGQDWTKTRQLVTPSKTFFSANAGHTQQVAQHIANDIAKLLPIPQIEVQPLPNLPEEYRHTYQATSNIAGTYMHDDEAPLISYDETLMRKPISFIDIMTHELMHARLAAYVYDMPGGEGAHELSTDLHCITHGFGIFTLEGPFQMGWSGYMTQETRAYACALFLDKYAIPVEDSLAWISPRPQKALRRAIAEYQAG